MTSETDNAQEIKKFVTNDGSISLYSSKYNQPYHNPNGAYSESRHVFLEPSPVSTKLKNRTHLSVFETGFGTGLNLLLLMDTLIENDQNQKLNYFTIEAALIPGNFLKQSGYEELLANPFLVNELADAVECCKPGNNRFGIGKNITVNLYNGLFKNFALENTTVDIVFHDPFSLQVNTELWSKHVFETLYGWSAGEAVLTTYAAASKARAAMAAAGWHVVRAPGALGKREMTLAAKQASLLNGFKRVNEQRLVRRLESGDFD